MGGDLVRDHTVLNIFLVRQVQGAPWASHSRALRSVPADHRRADGAGDVIVSGRDVGGQRPERIERRLVARFQLLGHVLVNQVHGHVPGAFDHHLHVVLPSDFGKLAQGFQFAELRFVVGIGNASRPQTVTQREETS